LLRLRGQVTRVTRVHQFFLIVAPEQPGSSITRNPDSPRPQGRVLSWHDNMPKEQREEILRAVFDEP
jgi:hypothetical protein